MSNTHTNHLPGPLAVSKTNPRYFSVKNKDGYEQAVYLTGSHIWNNFQDGLGPGKEAMPDKPEQNNFEAYLTFLKGCNHNFIRLWRWEHFKSNAGAADFHLNMSPQPWLRSGDVCAKDGKPKFHLSKFNDEYFERLRKRVIAAGEHGIYVDVMLFEGWGLHLSPAPDNVEGHPFHAKNNVNGVSITSILDYQVLPLSKPVQELQEAYIKKVIDTLHDLPNVLYEVANESSGGGKVGQEFADALSLSELPDWGDSTEWQYWVINLVQQYEKEKGYEHRPMGMTMQFPVEEQVKINEPLFNSPAEWISPGFDDEIFAHGGHPMDPNSLASHWYDNPPIATGKKVIISDTDHYAPGKGDAMWAWKSFLRGHHPILMDYGAMDVAHPEKTAPGAPPFEAYEPVRLAMGDTLRFAERIRLIDMEPRNDLSSTGYALANPGEEYIFLQPEETAESFSVVLEVGTYDVEWFGVADRKTKKVDELAVKEADKITFTPPFQSGPAVLYLKKK
jgi:hypothetical protein